MSAPGNCARASRPPESSATWKAFQRRANQNGGNRAATTPGYEASLAYVERRLENAGYDTERHAFDSATYVQNGPATLQREGQAPYVEGTDEAANDYYVAQFSGSGNVTAPLATISDITVPPPGGPGSGTSGCERETGLQATSRSPARSR